MSTSVLPWVVRMTGHIVEQVGKGQYLNALQTCHELQGRLLKASNDVLKGREETAMPPLSDVRRELLTLMRWFSREYFSAGWSTNLEHHLWGLVTKMPTGVDRDWLFQAVDHLQSLADAAEGWWAFVEMGDAPDHEDWVFIPMQEWKDRHEIWLQKWKDRVESWRQAR